MPRIAGINVFSAALLATVFAMVLIGIVLRRPLRVVAVFFEEQLEKTGFM